MSSKCSNKVIIQQNSKIIKFEFINDTLSFISPLKNIKLCFENTIFILQDHTDLFLSDNIDQNLYDHRWQT